MDAPGVTTGDFLGQNAQNAPRCVSRSLLRDCELFSHGLQYNCTRFSVLIQKDFFGAKVRCAKIPGSRLAAGHGPDGTTAGYAIPTQQAALGMRPCKLQAPNRTKMFRVKLSCPIGGPNRAKPAHRSQLFSRRMASTISRSGPAKESLIAAWPRKRSKSRPGVVATPVASSILAQKASESPLWREISA